LQARGDEDDEINDDNEDGQDLEKDLQHLQGLVGGQPEQKFYDKHDKINDETEDGCTSYDNEHEEVKDYEEDKHHEDKHHEEDKDREEDIDHEENKDNEKRVKEIENKLMYEMHEKVEVKNKSSDKWKDGVVMSDKMAPGRLFAENPFLKVTVSSCCGLISKRKHFEFIRKKDSKYRSLEKKLHLASLKGNMKTAELLSDTLIKNKHVLKQMTGYLKSLKQFHEDTKKAIIYLDADFLNSETVNKNLMGLEKRNKKILELAQNSFELQDPFKRGTQQEKLKYLLIKNSKKLSNLNSLESVKNCLENVKYVTPDDVQETDASAEVTRTMTFKKDKKFKGSSSCDPCAHLPNLYEAWTTFRNSKI